MRELIFKKLVKALRGHSSIIYGRLQIQILLLATAKAFSRKGKVIIFAKNPLERYMLYTRQCMQVDIDADKVYNVAYNLGKKVKNVTGLKRSEDLKELIYLFYQYIGINMSGELPKEFLVDGCYFSHYYCSNECSIMSLMDSGIIAGVYSDIIAPERLEFISRITEKCDKCRAHFAGGNRHE